MADRTGEVQAKESKGDRGGQDNPGRDCLEPLVSSLKNMVTTIQYVVVFKQRFLLEYTS